MDLRTVDQSSLPLWPGLSCSKNTGISELHIHSVTCDSAGVPATYNQAKMSTTSNPTVGAFNKSKEDFIWFVKRATTDKKSYSHSELYHSLLKMFVDADTNKDGLVSRASFSNLIDEAAAMPRAYGYAPTDADMWKNQQEKDASRQKMFDSMDLVSFNLLLYV